MLRDAKSFIVKKRYLFMKKVNISHIVDATHQKMGGDVWHPALTEVSKELMEHHGSYPHKGHSKKAQEILPRLKAVIEARAKKGDQKAKLTMAQFEATISLMGVRDQIAEFSKGGVNPRQEHKSKHTMTEFLNQLDMLMESKKSKSLVSKMTTELKYLPFFESLNRMETDVDHLITQIVIDYSGKHTMKRFARRMLHKAFKPYQQTGASRTEPALEWLVREAKSGRMKLRSFADVGCAAPLGAPTTAFSKRYFKKLFGDVRVDGYDIVPGKGVPRGVDVAVHDYRKKRLPKNYDAVLFANVAAHMPKSALKTTYQKLFASLNSGGVLIVGRSVVDGAIDLQIYRKSMVNKKAEIHQIFNERMVYNPWTMQH